VVWTNKILGEDGPNGQIQTPYGASTLADDRVLGIDGTEPPIREISHKERDTGPVGAAEVQRVDQTDAALDMCCPDESSISVARSSRLTLDPATASACMCTVDKP
jgi:hypothetical protein